MMKLSIPRIRDGNLKTPILRITIKKIRAYFSTTNWMERCFKELKDFLRIRGYLQSEESAEKDRDEKYFSLFKKT